MKLKKLARICLAVTAAACFALTGCASRVASDLAAEKSLESSIEEKGQQQRPQRIQQASLRSSLCP